MPCLTRPGGLFNSYLRPMDSVFLGKMLKLCPGYAHVIVCSVVGMDFDRSSAGTVSVLRSLPGIERISLGRSAWGSVIYLSDERQTQPQQSCGYVCFAVWDFQRQATDGSLEAKANILFPAQLGCLKVCMSAGSSPPCSSPRVRSVWAVPNPVQCLVRSVPSPLRVLS